MHYSIADMVPMCRRHLFSSIQLSSYKYTSNRKKIALLLENIEIASYVRRLSFTPSRRSQTIMQMPTLEFLLRHSTCLHSINLVANTNHIDWNDSNFRIFAAALQLIFLAAQKILMALPGIL